MSSRLGLARLLDRQPSPERSRVLALICQQVLQPGSKLACTRALTQSTLAGELAVVGVDADELYAALDWLLERQGRNERGARGPPPRRGTPWALPRSPPTF